MSWFYITIGGLYSISLEDHKSRRSKDCHLIPGTKLCKTCRIQLNKPNFSDNDDNNDNETNIQDSTDNDYELDEVVNIDETLMKYETSQFKKHGKWETHRKSEARRKLKTIQENLDSLKDNVLGEQNCNEEAISKITFEKAKHFDEIVAVVKEKLEISDKRTITQLLTVAPKSMSISKVMSTFNATEYQAKKSRKLLNEKGLMSMPPSYKGKVLLHNVLDIVTSFYENNEFSRLMPRKKDYVSIGKNIHQQKRLVLSNLKLNIPMSWLATPNFAH